MISFSSLAEITLVQQPTLTKAIERMEKSGLVTRRADPEDGRKVLVEATTRGIDMVRALFPAARAHEAQMLAGYDAKDASALKAALRLLIERTGS